MNKLIITLSIFFLCIDPIYAESLPAPLPGEIVHSPRASYILVKELGQGVFGRVFEAIDSQGERVALKWYLNSEGAEWKIGQLFTDSIREFLRGQLMDHPNIIKSLDHFTTDAGSYTVLEFVQGATLANKKKKSIEFDDGIAGAKQLVSALRHAYIQEYLHLDLHGNNVMLTHDRVLKVIDISSFLSFEEIQEVYAPEKETANLDYTTLKGKKIALIKQFQMNHPEIKISSESPSLITNFLVGNFNDITDICIRIFSKSNAPREQKLAVRAELKKLSWSCEADLEEGEKISFEQYLDTLDALLDVFSSSPYAIPDNASSLRTQ